MNRLPGRPVLEGVKLNLYYIEKIAVAFEAGLKATPYAIKASLSKLEGKDNRRAVCARIS
jgi:hypothetical protein